MEDDKELQFLSDLSHQLRTPITAIKSFVEILLKYPDESPEQRKEFLTIIQNETQRLLDLLNQRMEARRLELAPLPDHGGSTPQNHPIMVIDDEEKLLQSFCFYMGKENRETLTARSIKEAQILLQQYRPAVIFLDINLPDGNGYDFCEQLKLALPNRPVILISAQKQDKDRLRAMTVKADGFIS